MSIRAARICVFAIVIAGGFTFAHAAVANIVFTVNTTDDGVDAAPGDGTCSTSLVTPAPPNTCTLRAALMEANRTTGAGATIMLPAGLYKLAIGAHDADGEDNGDLNLSVPSGYTPGPTTITGAGAAVTIIDAQQIDRVLTVDSNRTASISGVTFRNGFTVGNGGGINNAGILTLTGSTLSTNSALYGGGIYNGGHIFASYCTLSGNIALPSHGGGGGIYVGTDSTAVIDHCTLSGNISDGYGGGIDNESLLEISYSTLNGNSAAKVGGGGIFNFATVTVEHSTLSDNIAAFGGGICSEKGTGSVSQTTISGNTAQAYNAGLPGIGGGIYAFGSALTVTDSTIALNNADAKGGGIYSDTGPVYNVNVYSSTIAYNGAASLGGGIFLNGTDDNGFNVYNTILAENFENNFFGQWDDCTAGNNGTSTGVLKTHARNLFGNGINCTIAAVSGSYATLNPLASLGSLQNNGGPTQTIALLAGSNAIDGTSVTGSICGDASVLLLVDQRGYPRTDACDVGAFEYDDIFIGGFE